MKGITILLTKIQPLQKITPIWIPLGVMNMVINGTQPPVPLSFTCLGFNSQPDTSIRELKEVSNDCSSNQYLNFKRKIYDIKLLSLLLNN